MAGAARVVARALRLAVRPQHGELLLDAAHNPAGAAALASYLQDTGSKKLPVVFAAMADKDLTNMIAPLLPVASAFIATTVPNARARPADQLAAEIRALAGAIPVEPIASPEAAVECARSTPPGAAQAGRAAPWRADRST